MINKQDGFKSRRAIAQAYGTDGVWVTKGHTWVLFGAYTVDGYVFNRRLRRWHYTGKRLITAVEKMRRLNFLQ